MNDYLTAALAAREAIRALLRHSDLAPLSAEAHKTAD